MSLEDLKIDRTKAVKCEVGETYGKSKYIRLVVAYLGPEKIIAVRGGYERQFEDGSSDVEYDTWNTAEEIKEPEMRYMTDVEIFKAVHIDKALLMRLDEGELDFKDIFNYHEVGRRLDNLKISRDWMNFKTLEEATWEECKVPKEGD